MPLLLLLLLIPVEEFECLFLLLIGFEGLSDVLDGLISPLRPGLFCAGFDFPIEFEGKVGIAASTIDGRG